MTSGSNSTIAKNTIFLSLRMLFVLFVSLYTSRVFLNVLGVEDFGINNVVCGFVALFSFLNTSLANGIQRFLNYEKEKRGDDGVNQVFNTSMMIQGGLAIIVFGLLETVGLWYVNTKMVIPMERLSAALWIYHFSALSAVVVILSAPYTAAVMAYERMNYFAFVGIADILLKLILALTLHLVNYDKLIFYGMALLAITILDFILYYAYSRSKFPCIRFSFRFSKDLFVRMMSFSGWGFLGTFACVAREQGLNMILNLFFGPVVNAARGIAYQVSSALQGFVSNISIAAKPQMVSSFAGGDSSRTVFLMYSMSKISYLVLLLMAIPICVDIQYILKIWLGDVVPEHTSSFVILIIMTNFMNNLNAPLSNVVYATGKMKAYELTFSSINLAIIPISYIALCCGCLPEAVFIVYFIMTVFVQIGCLVVLKNLVSISLMDYTKRIIIPLISCSLVVIPFPYLVSFYMQEGFARLVVITIVTVIIAMPAFYFIVLNNSEKSFVSSTLKRLMKKYENH